MPRHNRGGVPYKAKNAKKALVNLLKYLKTYKKALFCSIILFIAATVFRLIGPSQLQRITDIVSASIMPDGEPFSMQDIWKIAGVLIALYVLMVVFGYIANILITRVCFKMSQKLRGEISEKINRVPIKLIDKTPHGEILSTVTNDVDMIGQTLHQGVSEIIGAIILFLGSLIMMLVTNWMMALAAVASTIIGFAIMAIVISKSQKYFVEQQNKLAELDGVIEEVYSGQSVVKTYNGKYEVTGKFNDVNEKLHKAAWKSQFLSGAMHPLMGFIGNLGYVVVCVVGAVLVSRNAITIGTIVSFMIYIRFFTNPLSQIAQAMTSVQTAAAASERVFGFLGKKELDDESDKTLEIPEIKGDFSVEVKAGQKVAIVGPTGAGKTTIVNLLMRFYETNSGDIKIDGISIYDMTRVQLRNIFAMVLQDTWLFEGTIRENLIYNKKDVGDEVLDRACKACGLEHFIKTLPDGYDTVLSDETNVSVGQKQLLTIARAMIQNAPMLILDEATSNVDTRTEETIQKAMDKLMENRTSFVIAHRLSTIKNADVILVLKNGDVVESGNHTELIKKGGFYADLYNSQFSLEGCDLID